MNVAKCQRGFVLSDKELCPAVFVEMTEEDSAQVSLCSTICKTRKDSSFVFEKRKIAFSYEMWCAKVIPTFLDILKYSISPAGEKGKIFMNQKWANGCVIEYMFPGNKAFVDIRRYSVTRENMNASEITQHLNQTNGGIVKELLSQTGVRITLNEVENIIRFIPQIEKEYLIALDTLTERVDAKRKQNDLLSHFLIDIGSQHPLKRHKQVINELFQSTEFISPLAKTQSLHIPFQDV